MTPMSLLAADQAGSLKILVADDTEANLLLVGKFLTRLGHTVIPARNGQEAVEAFLRDPPDMILLDVMMPVMDGLEAAQRIRALASRWVPIIFISAKGHDLDQAKGLEIGGDDYLTKPINFVILEAKIKVMQRIATMQRQLAENAHQLELYRDEAEEEQRIATELLKRLIHDEGLQDKLVKHWVSPAKHFSGDLVAATRSRSNDLYAILADATGHGLPAALSLMPVTQIFYGMAEKGFSVAHIAEEMNRRIVATTPADRFVSAVIVCVSQRNRTVEVWNGGSPAPVYVTESGEITHEFGSQHLPLGILPPEAFNPRTELYQWERPGQLVMCSDGLLEAENGEGRAFGRPHFLDLLTLITDRQRFISLVAAVQEHLGSQQAHDDVSLLMVTCPTELPEKDAETLESTPHTTPAIPTGHWRIGITLGPPDIGRVDVVPLLLHQLEALQVDKAHSSQLFLILSELFNNALDHGLLQLDSGLKREAEGFERYITLREERLEHLQEGEIEIQLEHIVLENSRLLRIRVRDSGPGFDYNEFLERSLNGNTALYGRGIPLIKTLCTDVRYQGKGNEVVAHYAL